MIIGPCTITCSNRAPSHTFIYAEMLQLTRFEICSDHILDIYAQKNNHQLLTNLKYIGINISIGGAIFACDCTILQIHLFASAFDERTFHFVPFKMQWRFAKWKYMYWNEMSDLLTKWKSIMTIMAPLTMVTHIWQTSKCYGILCSALDNISIKNWQSRKLIFLSFVSNLVCMVYFMNSVGHIVIL